MTLFYPRAVNEVRMFVKAAQEANSVDPVKVAAKLDGMKVTVYNGGDGFMRADDHQFFQPMYIANLVRSARISRSTRRIPAGDGR